MDAGYAWQVFTSPSLPHFPALAINQSFSFIPLFPLFARLILRAG